MAIFLKKRPTKFFLPLYRRNMKISKEAWVAANATVLGHVEIEKEASIWFQAVLRAEQAKIKIEEGSNIQDHCVVHCSPGYDTIVEKGCTIGHGAILHGCHIEENVLVGMGAIVLNGARIAKNSIVAAGALVPQNKTFEEGVLILGSPAKAVRKLSEEEIEANKESAQEYIEMAKCYKADPMV